MLWYNINTKLHNIVLLNIRLSNSQLNNVKLGVKNGTQVTLILLSKTIDNSNDGINFPYKSLLTNTQVSSIHKAFANCSSTIIKFSKTQVPKIIQLGGIICDVPVVGNILSKLARWWKIQRKN